MAAGRLGGQAQSPAAGKAVTADRVSDTACTFLAGLHRAERATRGSQRFGPATLVEADEWLRLSAPRTSFDAANASRGQF